MYLQVKSVSKRFGSVEAVKDVSFHCARGELVSLLGPSGCGKTTTLRLLAGFEPPDSGAVFLDGASLEGVPPEGRGVGIVFQNYALFPHMSVGANITYGLRFVRPRLAAAEKAERLQELLELVDLAGYADRRPDQLSAGQQQRVAIARALAPKPRLLLLDEPLSALDAGLREQLRFQIRRIQQALGLTTVYVTHDQAEALAISDQVVIMREGRVAQAAPPREIYERPADRFVAQFVGGASLIPVRELAGFDGKAAPGRSGRFAGGSRLASSPVPRRPLPLRPAGRR